MRIERKAIAKKIEEFGINSVSTNELLIQIKQSPSADFFKTETYRLMKEIVRREEHVPQKRIKDANDCYEHLAFLEGEKVEYFYALFLRRNATVIESTMLSKGGIAMCVVDKMVLLKKALALGATSVVVSHNHPSGNLLPSDQDIAITKILKTGCEAIGVCLQDHIIIGNGTTENKFYSFASEGKL